jgi:hypothetical protein
LDRSESRDDYNWQVRDQALELPLQLMSVHSAHPEVRDERVRNLSLYDFKRLRSGIGAQWLVARLPQYIAQEVGHLAVVVNDHD